MEKIIIFGVGKGFEDLLEVGCIARYNVVALCDNDVKKQNMLIEGMRVITPDKIKEYKYDAIYISSEKYFSDISRQLENEFGIDPKIIKKFEIEKYDGEMIFWMNRFKVEGKRFKNAHYKDLMLGIAQEPDDKFLDGKIVADFGCGPRGSLMWTSTPKIKLGIDVLAGGYLKNFGDELIRHGMVYVTSDENRIPIPDNFVDCLFAINSLDHVVNLEKMANEILRILKPGGDLIASFNLNEPQTVCEPQTITENIIHERLLNKVEIQSYRKAYKDPIETYRNMKNNIFVDSLEDNKAGILWVRGRKK